MAAAEGSSASIGKSVEIRGEVKGSEDLMIDGRVEGTITLTDSKLTIGSTARVDADVAARDVVILGVLNGNVTAAARVDLRKGGNLTGNIRAARLSIEEGALVSGKVELTDPAGSRVAPLGNPAGGSLAPSQGGHAPVSTS
jgi:cytoskeletal protein CcmA (bactofilin family)